MTPTIGSYTWNGWQMALIARLPWPWMRYRGGYRIAKREGAK